MTGVGAGNTQEKRHHPSALSMVTRKGTDVSNQNL